MDPRIGNWWDDDGAGGGSIDGEGRDRCVGLGRKCFVFRFDLKFITARTAKAEPMLRSPKNPKKRTQISSNCGSGKEC